MRMRMRCSGEAATASEVRANRILFRLFGGAGVADEGKNEVDAPVLNQGSLPIFNVVQSVEEKPYL